MATEKLIAGAQGTYTTLMSAELNSLVSGNAIQGTSAVANASNLDLAAEFSFGGGTAVNATGSPYLGLYLYPLNQDGTTYGDNRFGSSAAGPPPSNYFRGYCGVGTGTATQVGSFAIPGSSIFQIPLPRGTFVPVLYNNLGNTLGTGNILAYRTTNRSVT